MTNPNGVLPRDVAIDFGLELLGKVQPALAMPLNEIEDPILESFGRIAFKRALEIAGQIDFGSEDVR